MGGGAVLSPHSVPGSGQGRKRWFMSFFSRAKGSISSSDEFRGTRPGSIPFDPLRQHDNSRLYHYRGGNHFPPPLFLSVDVESMEVVSSETHSPIRFSFFGGGKSVSSFSF